MRHLRTAEYDYRIVLSRPADGGVIGSIVAECCHLASAIAIKKELEQTYLGACYTIFERSGDRKWVFYA